MGVQRRDNWYALPTRRTGCLFGYSSCLCVWTGHDLSSSAALILKGSSVLGKCKARRRRVSMQAEIRDKEEWVTVGLLHNTAESDPKKRWLSATQVQPFISSIKRIIDRSIFSFPKRRRTVQEWTKKDNKRRNKACFLHVPLFLKPGLSRFTLFSATFR